MKMANVLRKVLLVCWASVLLVSCGLVSGESPEIVVPPSAASLTIESTAFDANGMIPAQYTCDGTDVSPSLRWNAVPAEAQSLALIMDDPDAPRGTFVHWVVYDMPPDVDGLAEEVPDDESLSVGGLQGRNGFRAIGYGGPCPPSGTHRYFFKLYALDTLLELPSGASKADVIKAMDGHVLAFGEVMGQYARQ